MLKIKLAFFCSLFFQVKSQYKVPKIFELKTWNKNFQNEEPIQYLQSAKVMYEKEKIFVLIGVQSFFISDLRDPDLFNPTKPYQPMAAKHGNPSKDCTP